MKLRNLAFLLFLGLFFVSTESCRSNKEGCPAYDNANVKPGKNGELPTTRGKSGLFPKNMQKKSR